MPVTAAPVPRLLDLRAPPAATMELDANQHAPECHALERMVLTYLREGWRVESRRCFLLQPIASWNSVEKFVESELRPSGAERQRFEWHDPGYDLVTVWHLRGSPEFISTAMSKASIEGQSLVGYFSLRHEK